MELQIKPFTIPEVIINNFEELKGEITKKSSDYATLVYTDEQMGEAKKDRATLNKFVKALDDERKRIKKKCLEPYEDVEPKFKELDDIVNQAINNIDSQVKGYEEKKKASKLKEIKELWESLDRPEGLKFDNVFMEQMLNSSFSMKKVNQYFVDAIDKFNRDIETLSNLPEFSFEAKEVYKSSLDLGKAIQEGQKLSDLAKRKAEHEARMQKFQQEKEEQERIAAEQRRLKAEEEAKIKEVAETAECFGTASSAGIIEAAHALAQSEPLFTPEDAERTWISFTAFLTVEDAMALKEFFESRNIEFKPI